MTDEPKTTTTDPDRTDNRSAAVLLGSLLAASERYLEWNEENWSNMDDLKEWHLLKAAIDKVRARLDSE